MHLKDYYWYFKSALPDRICDDIINLGKEKKHHMALIGNASKKGLANASKKEIKDVLKTRDSDIAWLDDLWIYNQVHPYIHAANESAGWNFQWDFSEACQFTKYKKGQYYGWHIDSWDGPYNNSEDKNLHGKIRKLSVTISLSDPNDYEGGELEFDCRNERFGKKKNLLTCSEIRPRGSIVVFPSFVWHRVKPVTKGVRYSLVIWNVGNPFK